MKISDLKTYVLGTAWRNLTYVELHTDDGLVGVGEVRMLNHTDALIGYFAEAAPNHILGSDPFNIEDLVARMFRNDYERTPAEFHAAAKRVLARGYRALKLDPFGAGFYELDRAETQRSIELVEAVRDAVGPDVDILVEMHGRFNPATAIDIARQLEPFHPGWVEEPVPPENLAALKKAAEHIRIPVATGERIHTRHEYRELFELQTADVIQPDITHFGGILETKKLAAWADAYYVLVAPHNVGGAVSTAANLHLAACTTNFKIQEHFNDFAEDFVKAAAPGNPEVVDGYFALPSGPGLGVTLNHDLIAANPRRQIFFNLFAENWHRRQAERA